MKQASTLTMFKHRQKQLYIYSSSTNTHTRASCFYFFTSCQCLSQSRVCPAANVKWSLATGAFTDDFFKHIMVLMGCSCKRTENGGDLLGSNLWRGRIFCPDLPLAVERVSWGGIYGYGS